MDGDRLSGEDLFVYVPVPVPVNKKHFKNVYPTDTQQTFTLDHTYSNVSRLSNQHSQQSSFDLGLNQQSSSQFSIATTNTSHLGLHQQSSLPCSIVNTNNSQQSSFDLGLNQQSSSQLSIATTNTSHFGLHQQSSLPCSIVNTNNSQQSSFDLGLNQQSSSQLSIATTNTSQQSSFDLGLNQQSSSQLSIATMNTSQQSSVDLGLNLIVSTNTNKQLNSHGLVANMQSTMCRKINVSSNKLINRDDLKYDNDKNDCVPHSTSDSLTCMLREDVKLRSISSNIDNNGSVKTSTRINDVIDKNDCVPHSTRDSLVLRDDVKLRSISSNIDNNGSVKTSTRINDVSLRGVNMSSLDLFNIDTMDTFGNRGGSSHSLSDKEVSTDDVLQQGDYTETEFKKLFICY